MKAIIISKKFNHPKTLKVLEKKLRVLLELISRKKNANESRENPIQEVLFIIPTDENLYEAEKQILKICNRPSINFTIGPANISYSIKEGEILTQEYAKNSISYEIKPIFFLHKKYISSIFRNNQLVIIYCTSVIQKNQKNATIIEKKTITPAAPPVKETIKVPEISEKKILEQIKARALFAHNWKMQIRNPLLQNIEEHLNIKQKFKKNKETFDKKEK